MGSTSSQLAVLAENLPQYRYNMVEKIQSLRSGAVGSGILGPVSKMLEDLKKEISRPAETPMSQRPIPISTTEGNISFRPSCGRRGVAARDVAGDRGPIDWAHRAIRTPITALPP